MFHIIYKPIAYICKYILYYMFVPIYAHEADQNIRNTSWFNSVKHNHQRLFFSSERAARQSTLHGDNTIKSVWIELSLSTLHSQLACCLLYHCYSPRDCKPIRKGITVDVEARTTSSLFKVIVLTGLFEWRMIASSVDIHGSCCRVLLNIMDFVNSG